MSKEGFHDAVAAISTLMFPELATQAKRMDRLMSVHLSPLVRYLNSQGGVPESQMTAEQQKHLDSFLTQKCIAFLGKHASALRRVFSQAAGFNQTPSVPNATWGMACQKNGYVC